MQQDGLQYWPVCSSSSPRHGNVEPVDFLKEPGLERIQGRRREPPPSPRRGLKEGAHRVHVHETLQPQLRR